MNSKLRQTTINENLKLLDRSYNFKEGIIKVNSHNTLKHELAKFIESYNLMKQGLEVYSEVIFLKGKLRADIYVPFWNQAIEIIESESKDSVAKKEKEYPCRVMFIKADDVLKQNGIEITSN